MLKYLDILLSKENMIIEYLSKLLGATEYSNLEKTIELIDENFFGFAEEFRKTGFLDTESRKITLDFVKTKISNGDLSIFRILAPFGFGKTTILAQLKKDIDDYNISYKGIPISVIFLSLNRIPTRNHLILEILGKLSKIDLYLVSDCFSKKISVSHNIDIQEIRDDINQFLVNYRDDEIRLEPNWLRDIDNGLILESLTLVLSDLEKKHNIVNIFFIDEFESLTRTKDFSKSYMDLFGKLIRFCYETKENFSSWRAIITDTSKREIDPDGEEITIDVLFEFLEKYGMQDNVQRIEQPEFSHQIYMTKKDAIEFLSRLIKLYMKLLLKFEKIPEWKALRKKNKIFPICDSFLDVIGSCLRTTGPSENIVSLRSALILASDTLRYFARKNNNFLNENKCSISGKYFWQHNDKILNIIDGNILSDSYGIRHIVQRNRFVNYISKNIIPKSTSNLMSIILKDTVDKAIISGEEVSQIKINTILTDLNLDINASNVIEEINSLELSDNYFNLVDDVIIVYVNNLEEEFILKLSSEDEITQILKDNLLFKIEGKCIIENDLLSLLEYISKDDRNYSHINNFVVYNAPRRTWSPKVIIFDNRTSKTEVKEQINNYGMGFGINIDQIYDINWPRESDIIVPPGCGILSEIIKEKIQTEFLKQFQDSTIIQNIESLQSKLSSLLDDFDEKDLLDVHLKHGYSKDNLKNVLIMFIIPLLIDYRIKDVEKPQISMKLNSLWDKIIDIIISVPRENEDIFSEQLIGISKVDKNLSMIIIKQILLQEKNTKPAEIIESDFKSIQDKYQLVFKKYRLEKLWNMNYTNSDFNSLRNDIRLQALILIEDEIKSKDNLPIKTKNAIDDIISIISEKEKISLSELSNLILKTNFSSLTENVKCSLILTVLLSIHYGYCIPDIRNDDIVLVSYKKRLENITYVKSQILKRYFNEIHSGIDQDTIRINQVNSLWKRITSKEITEKTEILKNVLKELSRLPEIEKSSEILSKTIEEIENLSNDSLLIDFSYIKEYLSFLSDILLLSNKSDEKISLSAIIGKWILSFVMELRQILSFNEYIKRLNVYIKNLGPISKENEISLESNILNKIQKIYEKLAIESITPEKTIKELETKLYKNLLIEINKSNDLIKLENTKKILAKYIPRIKIKSRIQSIDELYVEKREELEEKLDNFKAKAVEEITEKLNIAGSILNVIDSKKDEKDFKIKIDVLKNNSDEITDLRISDDCKEFFKKTTQLVKELADSCILYESKLSDEIDIYNLIMENKKNLNKILLKISNEDLFEIIGNSNLESNIKTQIIKILEFSRKKSIVLDLDWENG